MCVCPSKMGFYLEIFLETVTYRFVELIFDETLIKFFVVSYQLRRGGGNHLYVCKGMSGFIFVRVVS